MNIVKDLMVPVGVCGAVHQDMTVAQAIQTLSETRGNQNIPTGAFKHRVLLVLDDDHHVVGKLSHSEMVMNMDPIYRSLEDSQDIAHTSTAGLSQSLLKSLLRWDSLWNESFEHRRQMLLNLKVKNCMSIAMIDECVLETDLLEVAIHKLAIYRHQSLLVVGVDGVVWNSKVGRCFRAISSRCRGFEYLTRDASFSSMEIDYYFSDNWTRWTPAFDGRI